MEEITAKKDKMAVMPVKRLLLTMGIPMVLSMVLQAVYNIVDSAFVSNMAQYGEQALNALTLAFPVQMLMVAIGIGTGVGANALVARSLGQGDNEGASRASGNALLMAALIYVLFVLFGLLGAEPYIASQTGNETIKTMAVDYLQICCILSPGIVFFSIFEKLLQACGHTVYSTAAQIAGAVTNIILDPIMIYGFLGCPTLGVRGAAYATVIGQLVSCVLALIFHLRVNDKIVNSPRYFKPSARTIAQIYSIGLPAIIAQALMSVMTYGLNLILVGVSEEAVTAYGLYYKVQQFILFAAFGLRDAITPVISYAYGMMSKRRILDGEKYGMLFTLVIMLAGTLLLELFAEPLAGLFGLSAATYGLCVSAMRIVSAGFLFAGANIAFQGVFQALGGGAESLIVSLLRQLVLIFPLVLTFAAIAGGDSERTWLIWLAFPICEAASSAAAILLRRRLFRKRVAVIPEG